MLDADESMILRGMIHPAALAALRTEGRFRALSQRVLTPERPGLRAARGAVADVLFALAPDRVKRFEAQGVMYFDLGSLDVQSEATREVWETACDRLELPWASESTRRFLDRSVRTWRSRDGARVCVHRQGSGGAVETQSLHEDELLGADDPGALGVDTGGRIIALRALSRSAPRRQAVRGHTSEMPAGVMASSSMPVS